MSTLKRFLYHVQLGSLSSGMIALGIKYVDLLPGEAVVHQMEDRFIVLQHLEGVVVDSIQEADGVGLAKVSMEGCQTIVLLLRKLTVFVEVRMVWISVQRQVVLKSVMHEIQHLQQEVVHGHGHVME